MSDNNIFKPAIVIPAYRRPEHLLRLLDSVNRAVYPADDIPVVISVDGGGDTAVSEIASTYQFRQCSKVVIKRNENLGLRNHILTLGDLTEEYGSIILLEDDLIVSPAYYLYAQNALEVYKDEPKVAGISLYAQQFNETAELPFSPLNTGFDAYFMQIAASWGQVWSNTQWRLFREWYKKNQHEPFPGNGSVPKNVIHWPETSWKKFFISYLVQNNYWFVYPYASFSTGGTDLHAEHMLRGNTIFQVPLAMAAHLNPNFRFPELNDNIPFYDAYMEIKPEILKDWLHLSYKDIEMDLYGTKPPELLRNVKFVITPRRSDRVIQTFPVTYKPLEQNIIHQVIEGEKPFYSLSEPGQLQDYSDSNPEWKMVLTRHLSGVKLDTRQFAKGYLRHIILNKLFKTR